MQEESACFTLFYACTSGIPATRTGSERPGTPGRSEPPQNGDRARPARRRDAPRRTGRMIVCTYGIVFRPPPPRSPPRLGGAKMGVEQLRAGAKRPPLKPPAGAGALMRSTMRPPLAASPPGGPPNLLGAEGGRAFRLKGGPDGPPLRSGCQAGGERSGPVLGPKPPGGQTAGVAPCAGSSLGLAATPLWRELGTRAAFRRYPDRL